MIKENIIRRIDFKMIQILTYSGKENEFKGKDIVLNSIHDARSLDEFDINIISLTDKAMWKYTGTALDGINNVADLKSMRTMLFYSKKSINIIILPSNLEYQYDYDSYRSHKYRGQRELKNMIKDMGVILSNLHSSFNDIRIVYEKTVTKINGECINASFYFGDIKDALLVSDKSNKPTVFRQKNVIFSTLDLHNYEQVINFLKAVDLFYQEQTTPEWMEEIKMFDDAQQLMIIERNNQVIEEANENISSAMEKINKNSEYKSILYTNGEELVNVVFEILESMLGCDLSQFEDKKKEDFLFEKNGLVFIGEIKGVNHNVKSENISQLDVHYQGYLEENEERDQGNVKAILVMNHQKNKALDMRVPVHEKQINLAKRNGSLIVETITLLKLFERYIAGNITREECLELLKTNIGLLEI